MASSEKPSLNVQQDLAVADDVAQRALSAFAEEAVSHAVDKINQCRLENASLHAARDLLLKVQVKKGSDVLWEGSLLNCEDDDEYQHGEEEEESEETEATDYVVLSVDGVDPFPLEEIRGFSCNCSGLNPLSLSGQYLNNTMLWGDPRFSYVQEDDTVELNLKMGESCFVVGTLENFAGTIQYMKEVIELNRLCHFMMNIGMVNAITREPVRWFSDPTFEEAIEEATFRVTKIKLAKTAVRPVLDGEKIAVEQAENDESVQQLKKLAETLTTDSKLRNVSEEQAALLKENILLKASWDMVRSVQVGFTGREVCGHLDQGHCVPEANRSGPLWVVNLSSNPEGKISLMDICNMRVSLCGFSVNVSGWQVATTTQITPDASLMRVPYNENVSVYFTFDEGWNDIDLENVLDGRFFIDWLRVQVAGGSNNQTRHVIPTYDGSELFMKLAFLTFPVYMVHRNLEALGIENPAGGDEDDDGEE